MSKPKPPKTPEYETVQKQNAIKNLEMSNALIDRNFDAMAAGIRRDTTSAQAGANSADAAITNARRSAYSGEPMAVVSGAAAESINADAASLVGDDASGLRTMAQQGERQRNMARQTGNTLMDLGQQKSIRDSQSAHAKTMSTIDVLGVFGGGWCSRAMVGESGLETC